MAIKLFFLVNGIGVIFLLYVLLHLWNEDHQPGNTGRQHAIRLSREDRINIIAVTHPISQSAQGGLSVIPINTRVCNKEPKRGPRREVEEIRVRTGRISTT